MRNYVAARLCLLASLFSVSATADDTAPNRESRPARILFKWNHADDTGRLASVRPDGSDLKWHSDKITDGFMSSARWSPDGRRIAYNIQAIPDSTNFNDPPRKVFIRGADPKTPV